MFFRSGRFPRWLLCLSLGLLVPGVFLFTRSSAGRHTPRVSFAPDPAQMTALSQRTSPAPRNLSLRPDALKLSRLLGQRFGPTRRDIVTAVGTLVQNGVPQPVQIVRQPGERGERVEILSGASLLSWSETEGARGVGGVRASGTERLLIERLALDSPEQFILAQLRGASYQLVAHNMRPEGVGGADSYAGPVWDVIRIDDPEADEQRRPLSRWRLYYLNTTTGLLDKVV